MTKNLRNSQLFLKSKSLQTEIVNTLTGSFLLNTMLK